MNLFHRAMTALAGAAVFGAAAQAQSETVQPLQPADIFQLEAAASPRISPDGRRIAYLRARNDIRTDRSVSGLWLIDSDGSDHLPLVTGETSVSSPRWSPNGDRIAYVSNRDGAGVLRMIWMEDGRDAEIAVLPGAASGLAWSPQGDRLAFASFRPGRGASAAPIPPAPPGADWAAGARVEERLNYRVDGLGPLPVGAQQLFIVDAEGGVPVQVSHGPLPASGNFSWSAEGDALIFSADRREDSDTAAPDSELHHLDLASGEITQLTDRRGPDSAPRVSPNGELIAYLGNDDRRMGYHNTELYVMPAEGGEARALTADLDRSVGNPQWSRDGRGLYVQYDDRGATRIAYVPLDGEIRQIAVGTGPSSFGRPYTGGGFTVSRDGRVATTVSTPTRPANVAVTGRRGLNVITALNEDLLSRRHVSDAEEILWESPHDGREIQGWALYPPNFDPQQNYPLILEIHGGPFSAYGPVFSLEFQLMAAEGYVVFYTNPRGSTSYGDAFANLIHHHYPGEDYDDLIGGVDAMIERGYIDEDRLFVTGGSGGGVLTAWIVGNTDRFAASVVAKPVINWTSFVLYADFPAFFYRYWFSAPPWEDPDQYWERSPLSLVGNVTTPTMLMVGGSDVRTPVAETEQYYTALRLRGVPTRLVVIPDSFHSIANSRPSRLLTKVAEILRWFEEHDPANAEAEPGTASE